MAGVEVGRGTLQRAPTGSIFLVIESFPSFTWERDAKLNYPIGNHLNDSMLPLRFTRT